MNSKISINFIMKIINIIFLIVLENSILDCGMGIFGVSLALYYVLYALFFGSLQTGIAKMVSIRNNKGINGTSNSIAKPAVLYVIAVGAAILVFSVLGLEMFALKLFGMSYPVPAIQVLCVVLVMTGITDVLCGYHNGNGMAFVGNIANLLKCILPIVFSIFVVKGFSGYGNKVSELLKNPIIKDAYSAMGIAFVYLFSCCIIFLVVLFFTIKSKLSSHNRNNESGMRVRRTVASGFVSVNGKIMLNMIFPVLSVFAAVMFYIYGARKASLSMSDVYTNIGILFTRVLLPFVFVILVFSEYISREKHRLRVDYRKDELRIMTVRTQYMIKNTFFMLIPPMMVFIFLAAPISKVLFAGQSSLSANYLQTGGAILLLAGLVYAMGSILKAFDKERMVWIVQGCGVLAQIIFLFVGFSGGKGNSMMILYSFYFYYTLLMAAFLFMIMKIVRLDVLDILMKLGKYGVAGIIMMILFMILDKFIVMNIFLLLLSVFFGYLLYYLTLLALHGISKKDEAALKRTLNYYPVHFLRSRLRM